MKIKFDRNQQYQLDAINSTIDILEGQPLNKSGFEFSLSDQSGGSLQLSERGVGNQLQLSDEQILENLQKVQAANEIDPSESLQYIDIADENINPSFPNFSIEMETGTGKTYVYLRSIYELNKVYGFKKFVIVVPSVAIREGVLKNLQITHDHFQEIYDNVPANFEVYDSKKLSSLPNFSRSNTIQILVINIDSFTKDANIINQMRERGIRPIEYIQASNPIVILDEPQNMETEIRKTAINNLNPLFTLRYSATHTNSYNLIYKLDPVKAYDLGLVKQIEVDSVVSSGDAGGVYLKLDGFKLNKKSTVAKLTILKNGKNGIVKKAVTAKVGDNLFQLSSGVEAYREGFVINTIDSEEECIEFSGGIDLYKGEPIGGLNEEVQKEMIKATIENHLRKELKLSKLGIKVLSVFFIDKVANYRSYDSGGNEILGKYAAWFEELLSEMVKKPRYANLYSSDVSEMHNGYFAQDKKGRFKESKIGKTYKADEDVYELIMKDKERLLDINTPLRFVFSHSALREGWDNPNVFQICTLNETKSELKKRQEIGRGLRLCVDQDGVRNKDRAINKLTVIANESYEEFASQLQSEIEADTGVTFEGRIKDARKRTTVQLKKNWQLDEKFLNLWNRIKHKTEYSVNYSTDDLIQQASRGVLGMPFISKPQISRIKVATKFIRDDDGNLVEVGGDVKSSKEHIVENVRYDIPDFISYIQSKTELTRDTISKILLQSGRLGEIFNNPQMFMDHVVKAIKIEFDRLKIDGIKYEKIAGKIFEMQLFESTEIESYLDNLIAVKNQDKTIHDHILVDSMSTPEINFAKECETREDVLFYIKLPGWFTIKTPIGPYNPDWALIKKEDDDEKRIYFIAETKDPKAIKDKSLLRESERMKIHCGVEHFAEFDDVSFQAVGRVGDLN